MAASTLWGKQKAFLIEIYIIIIIIIKSGLWGYNFITIKIARCTKQHIFATVLRFPFKFRTLVPTPFLSVKIDFCDLHLFRAVDTTIVNPAG